MKKIDAFITIIGKLTAFLTLFMVLITCGIVLFRYALNQGSIAVQEIVMYFHATVFMLGAAYTMQSDGHVRVDIFYQKRSPKGQAIINLFGTFFLLIPMMLFIIWSSYEYVFNAWDIFEESRETGGLPLVYLLKSLMLLMPSLILLQAFADIVKHIFILKNHD
jgi:TRAP-type mannitol/chloroaromatic compound transport system permease small subunit